MAQRAHHTPSNLRPVFDITEYRRRLDGYRQELGFYRKVWSNNILDDAEVLLAELNYLIPRYIDKNKYINTLLAENQSLRTTIANQNTTARNLEHQLQLRRTYPLVGLDEVDLKESRRSDSRSNHYPHDSSSSSPFSSPSNSDDRRRPTFRTPSPSPDSSRRHRYHSTPPSSDSDPSRTRRSQSYIRVRPAEDGRGGERHYYYVCSRSARGERERTRERREHGEHGRRGLGKHVRWNGVKEVFLHPDDVGRREREDERRGRDRERERGREGERERGRGGYATDGGDGEWHYRSRRTERRRGSF